MKPPHLAMSVLIVWNLTEFALQPNKRPIEVEAGILICTVGIFASLIFLLSGSISIGKIAAIVFCGIQTAFGLFGAFNSPAQEGFGKVGPAVAALISASAVIGLLWKKSG